MTDKGRSACPDLDAEFVIDADIIAEFGSQSGGLVKLPFIPGFVSAGQDRQYTG